MELHPTWGTIFKKTRYQLGYINFCHNRVLSDYRSIAADGSFMTAPAPYQQFYNFHAIVGNRRIPVLFALMQNRAVGHYTRLLHLSKRLVRRLTNRGFNPTIIITDYEQGMINAIPLELPDTEHGGCLFHFD